MSRMSRIGMNEVTIIFVSHLLDVVPTSAIRQAHADGRILWTGI
jgi:hypothetical protein